LHSLGGERLWNLEGRRQGHGRGCTIREPTDNFAVVHLSVHRRAGDAVFQWWIPIAPFEAVPALLSVAAGIAGLIAGSSFHNRLSHLVSICGRKRLGNAVRAFTVITPVGAMGLFWLMMIAEVRSSLDTLLFLPVPSYQSMIVIGAVPEVCRDAANGYVVASLIFLPMLGIVGAELALVILALRHLRKARHEMKWRK
jgi:hypothetical protein